MMKDDIRIAIVDENAVRASILEGGLREAGYADVAWIKEMTNLLAQLVSLDPDVILIDLQNSSRDVIEQMFQVSRSVRRPVAMFVDQADTTMIEAAIDAGVSSYIVDGLTKERVKPILDLTIKRFNAFAYLEDELSKARRELEDRKIIDRAKGVLMKRNRLSEDEAYALMRKTAMDNNTRIADVARSVMTATGLLK